MAQRNIFAIFIIVKITVVATVEVNAIVRTLSGKVGDIVIKQYRSGSVVTKVPDMSNIIPSRKQKQKRSQFGEAVAYAQSILNDPQKKSAFQAKLKRGQSVYHAAIAEYLKRNSKR